MNVEFRSKELARVCNSDSARLATYGPDGSAVIRRRLGQLLAAVRLADMRTFPGTRIRTALTGGRHTVLLAAGPTLDVLLRPGKDDAPADLPLDEEWVKSVVIDDIVSITAASKSARSTAAPARKRISQ
ncbi:hypothetical protein GCM10010492_67000 [Saccharothrix mutabilis subsp. mutabilis]|uniref:Uncharacterized protein n=1 Tax=Saccharothrix mutabilis subsp. mutabilis TaxID=66855 RepID=A0ABP3EBU8_9PSEU